LPAAYNAVHDILVPLALERERTLLAKLSKVHGQAFIAGLAELEGALRLNDE
jgi:hypothetical protein